jgi:PAS domain S-box-containing protein
MHRLALDNYSGWQVIHLRSRKAIAKTVSDPFFRIAGPLILTLCVLIGLSVFFLYRKASVEIFMRQSAEKALRESEERYRRLYHHTPAMLHSIDINGRIVSVSDYWSEVMGYPREEVIGRRLTSFFSEESRRHAEEEVFPEFFRAGFIKDVAYQFVKKDGRTIDVLLSAIADRDRQDNIIRTLAVSMDVTERKRAEEALKLAKEELSRYSKDLERQVQSRTREIHSNITALKKTQDQLRRLSASIMASQEKERSAIARELHDELGQVLTALRMDAVWIQERLKGTDAKASERALTMCQLIDKNIEDVRGMVFRLRSRGPGRSGACGCPGLVHD